MQLPYDKIDYI